MLISTSGCHPTIAGVGFGGEICLTFIDPHHPLPTDCPAHGCRLRLPSQGLEDQFGQVPVQENRAEIDKAIRTAWDEEPLPYNDCSHPPTVVQACVGQQIV